MNNQTSSHKIIILIIIATLITIPLILGITMTIIYNNTNSALIRIVTRPSDATVILDGEPIDASSGLIQTTPGDHSIAIIRDGFFPDGEEFSIKANETHDSVIILSPYSNEAKKLSESF